MIKHEITPSKINTQQRFVGSKLGSYERETVARNIVVLSQIIAESREDDAWPTFSIEEYVGVRNQTSEERVSCNERQVLGKLMTAGYLAQDERGEYSVTDGFLEVMADFATAESFATPAAE